MTQAATEKFATELKWAVIHSVMYLAWMLAERVAGFHDVRLEQQPTVGPLILIPSIVIYVLALRDRKRRSDGKMTYGRAFLSGCGLPRFASRGRPPGSGFDARLAVMIRG